MKMEVAYMKFPVENMPKLARDFAAYKLTIQGCSQKTVDEYLSDLRLFFRYIYAIRSRIKPTSEEFEKIDISVIESMLSCKIKTLLACIIKPPLNLFYIYNNTKFSNLYHF